jgi:hypothetical protein
MVEGCWHPKKAENKLPIDKVLRVDQRCGAVLASMVTAMPAVR